MKRSADAVADNLYLLLGAIEFPGIKVPGFQAMERSQTNPNMFYMVIGDQTFSVLVTEVRHAI